MGRARTRSGSTHNASARRFRRALGSHGMADRTVRSSAILSRSPPADHAPLVKSVSSTRWQVNRLLLRWWPSVDVELVALRVLHRDRVVVKAVGVQDADYHATQTGQPARLRVDALPADLDRNRAAAADAEIEVQPVLHRLAVGYHLEPDPWPAACRIDDAVRTDAQLILWYPDISPVLIPAAEASRRRLQLIPQRGGPKASQRFRIGAVDHQLEAGGHRSLPDSDNVSPPACTKPLPPPPPSPSRPLRIFPSLS